VVSSQFIELSLLIFVIIGGNYFIISVFKLENNHPNFFKKISIWLMLTINLLFAFILGFTLPILVSESKDMMGYVMIPLLIILNYIILDRFHYYQKHSEDRLERKDER
jgi:hypothetical protein